jgi:hypothetical protein
VLIDDDYYIDMPNHLCRAGGDFLIFTFMPMAAGGKVYGAEFYFEDNMLHFHVPGGAEYQHQIWDWGPDVFSVFDGWTYRVYKSEKRTLDYIHTAVLLQEVGTWTGIMAWLARLVLRHRTIERFRPCTNLTTGEQVTTIKIVTDRSSGKKEKYKSGISIALSGHPWAHRFDEKEWMDTTSYAASVDPKNPVTVAGLGRQIAKPRERPGALALLKLRMRDKYPPARVYPVDYVPELTTRTFSYGGDPAEAVVAMHPFMSPLDPKDWSPLLNKMAIEQGINGRYKKIQAKSSYTAHWNGKKIMKEFIHLVIEDLANEVVDSSPDTLRDDELLLIVQLEKHLKEISTLTALAQQLGEFRKGFVKKESYGKVTDPRLIMGSARSSKFHEKRLLYKLIEMHKKLLWYCPGSTPAEIAECVVKACLAAKLGVAMTDINRLDGSILQEVAELLGIYVSAFDIDPEVMRDATLGTTIFESRVDPDEAVVEHIQGLASGKYVTSFFGTLINAFAVFYATVRSGTTPREAYEKLKNSGLFGDDGIIVDPVQQLGKYTAELGLSYDVDLIPVGAPGVNFLSRYYSQDVWRGSVYSTCDIPRQLRKFHLTAKHPSQFRPTQKAFDKSLSALFSDHSTPIIGPMCHEILRRVRLVTDADKKHKSSESEQYFYSVYGEQTSGFPNIKEASDEIFSENNWDELYDQTFFQLWLDEEDPKDIKDVENWLCRAPQIADTVFEVLPENAVEVLIRLRSGM